MLIREKDKLALLRIFSSVNFPMEVWAYGSRVNGAAHDGSDLDLAIRSSNLTPIPVQAFGELYEKIKESNIPILVELRDWALLPDNFHINIEQKYEVLFDNRSNFD
jgi:predicted nucleotidyltransferase